MTYQIRRVLKSGKVSEKVWGAFLTLPAALRWFDALNDNGSTRYVITNINGVEMSPTVLESHRQAIADRKTNVFEPAIVTYVGETGFKFKGYGTEKVFNSKKHIVKVNLFS